VEPHEGVSPEAIATWRPDAVILSTSSSEDFVRCLLAVDEGRSWFDPGVRVQNGDEPAPNLASALSGRELEVARLASAGLSNKQIARILNISDGTIKIHMHHILGKLNLGSRSALAGLSPDLADTQTERGTDAIPVESDDSLPWRLKRARDCS
jgi:two-component system, NarL family, nitrate/nitrite response regulator NarL